MIIPRVASGLCAFGEAVADVKHTYLTSYTVQLPELDPQRLSRLFLELEHQGREDLRSEGFADADIYVERSVDMKYVDQVHECRVEIPLFEIDDASVTEIENAFHRRHEALYTYCEPDNIAELINIEVSVYGRSPKFERPDGSALPCEAAQTTPSPRLLLRRVRRTSADRRVRRDASERRGHDRGPGDC